MQTLPIGDKLPSMQDFYVRVKEKGDSITFRVAQDPVYEGKHFKQTAEGWDVTSCPRINNPEQNEECDLCNKYFELMGEAKKIKDVDKKEYETLREDARKYNVSIQFYFAILNREEKKFQVLRTTMGVKNKMDEDLLAGVKVMNVDWVLKNTGSKSPRDLYALTRLDSADAKRFDKTDKEEYKKAQDYDMDTISSNTTNREDNTGVSVEEVGKIMDK